MENIYFDFKQLKYFGVGAIIGKTVRLRRPEECIIGDGAIIDDFAYISCPVEIGRHCHIASHSCISGAGGRLKMGDYSTLATHCSVHCASSDYTALSMDIPSVPAAERFGGTVGEVSIGRYVVVGAHSCILPGTTLPDACAFGAYSLIKPDCYQPLGLYIGIPAEFRGFRTIPDDAPAQLRDLKASLVPARS